jgi:hypothetical protein
LAAVTTDAILGSAVYDLMQRHGVVDIDVRSATWRRNGLGQCWPVYMELVKWLRPGQTAEQQ